jgi:hypothetical protein
LNFIQKGIANFLGYDRFVNPIYFERYSSQFVDPHTDYQDFSEDSRKLNIVFTNSAVLKVFQLCCNMMSLGKIYVYKGDVNQKTDPFLDFIKKPNFFQQRNQYLWDYQFWKMIGNAYAYVDSKRVDNEKNKSYFLDSSKIKLPVEMLEMKDRIVLSDATINKINSFDVSYYYSNGEKTSFKWANIIHVPDLTNGVGNWFKGPSKIDAMYKIICNNEQGLDSTNINLRFAGKFIVAGKSAVEDVTKIPLSNPEKEDIENKALSNNPVHALKSLVDVKRFVEDAAIVGELNKNYLETYFMIGSLWDIPKDVLEAFNSGTYENQEKARGAFISYCLSPSGEQLMTAFEDFFGYTDKSIIIDWEHLPFMQVFAKERAETNKVNSETLLNYMKAGVKVAEINSILDLNLTELDYDRAERSNQSGTNSQNTNGNQSGN